MPPKKSRTATTVWKSIRRQVLAAAKRDGLTHCPICKVLLNWEIARRPDSIEVDHIVPHALGGTDTYTNARAICRSCNQKLGTQTQRLVYAQRAARRRQRLPSQTLPTSTDW